MKRATDGQTERLVCTDRGTSGARDLPISHTLMLMLMFLVPRWAAVLNTVHLIQSGWEQEGGRGN
jgi:hypothetical protein